MRNAALTHTTRSLGVAEFRPLTSLDPLTRPVIVALGIGEAVDIAARSSVLGQDFLRAATHLALRRRVLPVPEVTA